MSEPYGDAGIIDAEDVPRLWQPRFEALPGGGHAFALDDHGVRVELRYLRREHGHLYGEVDVRCSWAGASRHNGSLSCADLNLSSQTARKTLAKYCGERAHTKARRLRLDGRDRRGLSRDHRC